MARLSAPRTQQAAPAQPDDRCGETIPLDGVRFEIPINELTAEQIKNSWLVFGIVEEAPMPDGQPKGGVSYVHATTALSGSPTGYPPKRETMASGDLKVLENALSPLFSALEPKPQVNYLPDENSVQADYRTKSYKVQKASPNGKAPQGARFENGPDEQGFKLTAHLQNARTVNQPEAPTTIQHPNWKTEIGQTPVAGTQKQVYWSLSYGAQTDEALLDKMRTSLKSLAVSSN